jgi:hypothetical protein
VNISRGFLGLLKLHFNLPVNSGVLLPEVVQAVMKITVYVPGGNGHGNQQTLADIIKYLSLGGPVKSIKTQNGYEQNGQKKRALQITQKDFKLL